MSRQFVEGFALTKHARSRIGSRGFSEAEVALALREPREVRRQPRYDVKGTDLKGYAYRRGGVAVCVLESPSEKVVSTVVYEDKAWWRDDLAFLAEVAIGEWADRLFKD